MRMRYNQLRYLYTKHPISKEYKFKYVSREYMVRYQRARYESFILKLAEALKGKGYPFYLPAFLDSHFFFSLFLRKDLYHMETLVPLRWKHPLRLSQQSFLISQIEFSFHFHLAKHGRRRVRAFRVLLCPILLGLSLVIFLFLEIYYVMNREIPFIRDIV